MKIVSPVLDFLGHKLVGSASAMFGLPAGAFADLYLMHYDRPAPQPDEVEKPEWMRRRVFEIYIRRQLSLRVGILASVLAMAVVVAGLLMLGGTAGVQQAIAAHKAHEAEAATQAHAVDSMVQQYAQQCRLYVGQTLLPITTQNAASMGCDPKTGKLDDDTARAWAAKQLGGNP